MYISSISISLSLSLVKVPSPPRILNNMSGKAWSLSMYAYTMYVIRYMYMHTSTLGDSGSQGFCISSERLLWKFCGELQRLSFPPCEITKTCCGDLRRRRIRAKTAQTTVKILARETPWSILSYIFSLSLSFYVCIHVYIYIYIYYTCTYYISLSLSLVKFLSPPRSPTQPRTHVYYTYIHLSLSIYIYMLLS